jgi:ADP-heptose:LPS heptosyltransferase
MENKDVRKILYAPPRGIGDMMFSLPLLHSLREAYPRAGIYTPVPKDKKNVVDLVGFLKTTPRWLPKPSEDSLARDRWQASVNGDTHEKYRLEKLIYEKYLNGEEFDLALIPKDFTIDSIDCPMQVCERDLRKAGIDTNRGHMVDRFLGLADYLGIKRKMCFDLDVDREKGTTLTSGWDVESDKPYVVLNLGASLGRKVWSDKGYRETASWCLDNGLNVILVGDKDCFDRALGIQGEEGRVFNTVLRKGYSFDLENFARLSLKANVIVSPDTGVLHIADAIGGQVIGLYGPTSPTKYAPYNNRNKIISRFNSDQNVQNIPSREVIKKIEEVMQK